ncbi:hypothetical protein ACP70R_034060 [Stipagrostis hirtigluma subsp. patula]
MCVNVAVAVDSKWLNGGQVLARDERWYEVGGAFRVQGPDAGVELMVAGLQVFPVDRKARVKRLRKLTDKVRKRDVVVKLTGADGAAVKAADGVDVRVPQVSNSFPLGACIMRTNMDNEDFVDFFTKNFNWAVFGNELKWYWTEPQRGQLNYGDADDLLRLCSDHWVKTLAADELSAAVKSRITDLLTRYKGKFKHYDVNNEMLHGSFYQDKLGKDARAAVFKTAAGLDPDALLFVNDYVARQRGSRRSARSLPGTPSRTSLPQGSSRRRRRRRGSFGSGPRLSPLVSGEMDSDTSLRVKKGNLEKKDVQTKASQERDDERGRRLELLREMEASS